MTVFIVQDQKCVRPGKGLVPKFDFAPAEKFGRLEFLLRGSASPFELEPVVEALHVKLSQFCDDDFLVLTGNPVLLGLAVAVAAHYNNGTVKMLQWNGKQQAYLPVVAASVFVDPTEPLGAK